MQSALLVQDVITSQLLLTHRVPCAHVDESRHSTQVPSGAHNGVGDVQSESAWHVDSGTQLLPTH